MIALNKEYMSVLTDGKCQFIKLSTYSTEKIFPLKDTEDQIYFVAMNENFLIYSDSNGRVKMYAIKENLGFVWEYKFDNNNITLKF